MQGWQGCNSLTAVIQGCIRKAELEHGKTLRAVNTLWAFNGGSTLPPQPDIITNATPLRVFDERKCSAEGVWSERYNYAPGAGAEAALGIKAEIALRAEGKVVLFLNRIGLECASGACATGEARSRFSLDFSDLVVLTADLRAYLDRREVEDARQEWYLPNGENPETLRRYLGLRMTWCRGTSITGWGGGVQTWPIGLSFSGSGPDNQGEMIQLSAIARLERDISVCLRAPVLQPGAASPASFALRMEAKVNADTELAGAALAKADASVTLNRMEIRFEPGCLECEVAGDPIGPGEHQGDRPGIG